MSRSTLSAARTTILAPVIPIFRNVVDAGKVWIAVIGVVILFLHYHIGTFLLYHYLISIILVVGGGNVEETGNHLEGGGRSGSPLSYEAPVSEPPLEDPRGGGRETTSPRSAS
jgi:hypothetical protein